MAGAPDPEIHDGPLVSRVAVMGDDTPGLRARLAVAEGDSVRRGQLLFEDRVRPGIRYTSPGAGRVAAIFRGHRRVLRSVVIQLSESESAGQPGDAEFEAFASFSPGLAEGPDRAAVRALLTLHGVPHATPVSRWPRPSSSTT